jgi:hypothetical protein
MIKQKKTPKRLCSGCQTFQDKKAMVRIVRTPTGEVIVDPSGKAPGRGGYVCKNVECIQKARTGKGLERALKSAVPVAVYDSLVKILEPS